MKKIALPILFAFLASMFVSCDDSLPEVTTEEALISYNAVIFAVTYGFQDESNLPDGVEGTMDGTATFTSYEISSVDFPYTSVSGTIVQDESTDSIVIDLTLTGGPVITFYISGTFAGEDMEIIINGHDMSEELSDSIMF